MTVGPFDKAFYISTKANQREQLERTLIRQMHPSQNRAHRTVVGVANGQHAVDETSNADQ